MKRHAESEHRGINRYTANKMIVLSAVVILLLFMWYRYGKKPSRADTNLEFWIAENVENVDFGQYQAKHGLMGGREYYGSGYIPLTNENGEQTDPEYCVVYTVTSYPDYMSNRSHITRIWITDPSVEVYGLTLNSTIEEIEQTMKSKGFRIEYSAGGLIAEKGKFLFRFSTDYIIMSVKVSNLFGIQF